MFNRKKNLKPYFRDYVQRDAGFKEYLSDSIEYLRKQGNEHAKDFDLKGLLKALPDDLSPQEITRKERVSDEGRALIKEMMDKMGFQIFADMMAEMGFEEDQIKLLISSEQKGEKMPIGTPSGKHVPGFNDVNKVAEAQKHAEFLYEKTLEVMGSIIDDALTINNPQMLKPIIAQMEKVINEKRPDANESSIEVMTELLESTRVFVELIDDNETTVEEYESFLNKLVNFFIEDEINDTNNDAIKEHEGHDPEECDFIKKTQGDKPLVVLYRRIHAMDGTDGNKCEAIPNLSLIVLDTVRGQVIPIAFSIHEAMTEKTGQNFNEACRSEEGTEFILKTLVEYRKTNEKRFDEIVEARQVEVGGEEALAAAIAVKPEIVTPKASVLRGLLDEVRETFNADAKEVFADINPEDFLK